MAGPHWERSFNANSVIRCNSPVSVNQISRFFSTLSLKPQTENRYSSLPGAISPQQAPFPEQSCPVLLFYWSGFRKEAPDPWSIFSIYMVHPGCGINGGGESETEENSTEYAWLLICQLADHSALSLLMGNTPVRAPGARRRNIWFFRIFFTFPVWRNMHPFCVFAVRYSRRRRGVVRLFKNKKKTTIV